MMADPFITSESECSINQINSLAENILDIGCRYFGYEPYPPDIQMITSEQMVDAYTSVGLPIYYHHWSFGKHFTAQWDQYRRGHMGLAYEIVINSNPCIAYLMEENSLMMQALVLAHASIGHSHFFRNNYLFKQWTDASSIVDYLIFARNFIHECEIREGRHEVERFLDSCHALMDYGVNRFKRPGKMSPAKEKHRQEERETYLQSRINELYLSIEKGNASEKKVSQFPPEPEENLLYFCEKYAPDLPVWKREILRIVRKVAQYFYPQGQTKCINEGCATYTHYRIMNKLHDDGYMTDGAYLEFLQSHTNVVFQPGFDDPRYSGINPYALGFAMMQDIERICHHPTEEDREWFPDFAGCKDEMNVLREGWAEYRDESFIRQFLSPEVIRKMGLFHLRDDRREDDYVVKAIHNERGYRQVRDALADRYERHETVPQIEVKRVDSLTRQLYLEYKPYKKRSLGNVHTMVKHAEVLWGHPVNVYDNKGNFLG